jgi:signal transduction histidine kinase
MAVEETRYHHALVNAERLAAVGQTIAALSHHIKNILQGLKSGGDILKMGLSSMDQLLLQQGWKLTEKNLGKIQDLVMDMLSYSKERVPNIEATDLNAIAREVLGSLLPRAKEMGVQLKMRLDGTLPLVPVDPHGLHHALLNLVGNALDAVEETEQAKVVVRTEREPIVDVSKGAWVRIQVEDNGHGIPPEKLADIFRPFVSTKGARGTGLGLAVSRKILREHGGDIRAESTPGQGSRFTIRLPLRSPLGDSQGTQTELPVVPPAD